MRKLVFSVLFFAFVSNIAVARDDDADAATPGPYKCARVQASTVFVPDRKFNRKKGSAGKISDSHKNAETQGWSFDEM